MDNVNPGILPSFGFFTLKSLILEISVTGYNHQGGINGRMDMNIYVFEADL